MSEQWNSHEPGSTSVLPHTELNVIRLVVGLADWDDEAMIRNTFPPGNEHGVELMGRFTDVASVYEGCLEYEADVALLDPRLRGTKEALTETIQRLFHHAARPIVTVGAVPNPDWAVTMERAGVLGHVNLPLTADQIGRLVNLLPRVLREAYQARTSDTYIPQLSARAAYEIARNGWKRQTIAIWGPKGGIGKSFIATNLAVALGTVANRRTVLIDADLNCGNVHYYLSLPRQKNIFGLGMVYKANRNRMTPAVVQEHLTPCQGNLWVLVGIPNMTVGGHEALVRDQGEAFMGSLLDTLDAMTFDFVVVDVGQNFHNLMHLTALRRATSNLVIVNANKASVYDLEGALPPLKELVEISPDRFHLLFNRYHKAFGIDRKEVVSRVGLPEFGCIPVSEDGEVEISLNTSRPLVLGKPSPVSDALVEVSAAFYPPLREIWSRRGGYGDRPPGLGLSRFFRQGGNGR